MPKSIGQIGGGKNKRIGILDIGIVQSLYNNREVKAKYICGLTATPIRKDGHHPIITMKCEPIRHKVNHKEISLMSGVTTKTERTIKSIELHSKIHNPEEKTHCVSMLYELLEKFGDDYSKKRFIRIIFLIQ